MSRIIRSLLVLSLLAVSAVGVAACGGSSKNDPDKLLKESFTGHKKFGSGRLNLSLSVNAKGVPNLPGPVSLKLTGPFQAEGTRKLAKFQVTANITAAGQTFNVGATSTGDKGYLSLQGQNYEVPPDVFAQFKQGFEQGQPQQGGQGTLASLGIQPLDWVESPKYEGEQKVGGVDTKHVSGKINVSKFLDSINKLLEQASKRNLGQGRKVPQKITPEEKKRIVAAVKKATFDVYTNPTDKTPRKIQVTLAVAQAKGGAGGAQSADIAFTLEIDDLNKPQTITAPASPRPFAELLSTLQSFGLGGGSAAPGGPGGGPGGRPGGPGGPGGGPGGPGGGLGGPGGATPGGGPPRGRP